MTAAMAICLLMAGAPEVRIARAEAPAMCLSEHGAARHASASRLIMPKDAPQEERLLSRGVGARPSVNAPNHGGGDPLWNGILIGAALGVVAIMTTAAEAPPSGKAATVVMIAALGGYVDSRLAVTSVVRPGAGIRGWRIALFKSARF